MGRRSLVAISFFCAFSLTEQVRLRFSLTCVLSILNHLTVDAINNQDEQSDPPESLVGLQSFYKAETSEPHRDVTLVIVSLNVIILKSSGFPLKCFVKNFCDQCDQYLIICNDEMHNMK